jgi:hypothetical protein
MHISLFKKCTVCLLSEEGDFNHTRQLGNVNTEYQLFCTFSFTPDLSFPSILATALKIYLIGTVHTFRAGM